MPLLIAAEAALTVVPDKLPPFHHAIAFRPCTGPLNTALVEQRGCCEVVRERPLLVALIRNFPLHLRTVAVSQSMVFLSSAASLRPMRCGNSSCVLCDVHGCFTTRPWQHPHRHRRGRARPADEQAPRQYFAHVLYTRMHVVCVSLLSSARACVHRVMRGTHLRLHTCTTARMRTGVGV